MRQKIPREFLELISWSCWWVKVIRSERNSLVPWSPIIRKFSFRPASLVDIILIAIERLGNPLAGQRWPRSPALGASPRPILLLPYLPLHGRIYSAPDSIYSRYIWCGNRVALHPRELMEEKRVSKRCELYIYIYIYIDIDSRGMMDFLKNFRISLELNIEFKF